MIYNFVVKVHDISKLRFIDFEEVSLQVELSFLPSEMTFCENYIACMNHDHMHMFKIVPIVTATMENNAEDSDDFNFKCEYIFLDIDIDLKTKITTIS